MRLNEAKEILKSNGYICEGRKKSEEDKVEDYVIARLKGVGFDEPDWNGDEDGYEWEMDCETDGYRIEVVSLNGKKFLLCVKDGYKEIDLKVPGVRAFRHDRYGIGYHWTNYEKLLTDIEKVIIYLHDEMDESKENLKYNGFLLEYEEEHGFCVGNNVYNSKESAETLLRDRIIDLEYKLELTGDPKYEEYLEAAKEDLEALQNGDGYGVHIDPDRGCWVAD